MPLLRLVPNFGEAIVAIDIADQIGDDRQQEAPLQQLDGELGGGGFQGASVGRLSSLTFFAFVGLEG